MAKTVSNETAKRPYRIRGNRRQSRFPCTHALDQNVEAANGRLKQQNSKSDRERLIINTAVALRTFLHRANAIIVIRLPGTPTRIKTMQVAEANVNSVDE